MNKRMTKEQLDSFVAAIAELRNHNAFADSIWPFVAREKDARMKQKTYMKAFEDAAELLVVMKKSVASTDPAKAQASLDEFKSKMNDLMDLP